MFMQNANYFDSLNLKILQPRLTWTRGVNLVFFSKQIFQHIWGIMIIIACCHVNDLRFACQVQITVHVHLVLSFAL